MIVPQQYKCDSLGCRAERLETNHWFVVREMDNRMKRSATCVTCGNRIVRTFSGTWAHTGRKTIYCPIQQAINYRPVAEPKEKQ